MTPSRHSRSWIIGLLVLTTVALMISGCGSRGRQRAAAKLDPTHTPEPQVVSFATVAATPTSLPVVATLPPTPVPLPPTSTPVPVPPTPTFEPPPGFIPYQDDEAGISIYIPGDWFITGVINGQYAIFQSYPENKYVGGEGFQPGDSKCDLNLRLEAATPEELLSEWASNSITTIISQEQVALVSGLPGLRVELDSMGRSLSMFTEINGRVIALTCYAALEYFDEMANTLQSLP